jgi:IMP cyclohydrolase
MANLDRVDAYAKANVAWLRENPYPGRGIVAGLDERGRLVQVYWIMGRSDNSRNRVLTAENGRVFTEAANPAKMRDPALIIYNAMNEGVRDKSWYFVVSNGDQTDTCLESGPWALDNSLKERTYEPDDPNFTQRITAVFSLSREDPILQMSVLRRSLFDDSCDRIAYSYSGLAPGLGYCITTYVGDGSPLPPFREEPLLMPLVGGIDAVARTYWGFLNEANRVSLVVKYIDRPRGVSTVRIINKYNKVE